MKDFNEFEKRINITFNNKELLRRAFTHRSFVNENRGVKKHNERLEFLGDAVLELVITEYLFDKYPDKPEGELTAVRAALVNTQSIAEAARELGINDYLLLSRGEAKDVGRARQFILANTFEALLGAIYLDQGYNKAREHVAHSLFDRTDEIVEKRLWQDAKSFLQEVTQDRLNITPTYKTKKEEGPDHDRHFTVSVMFDEEEITEGEGKSKQEAEQDAARKALMVKEWNG